jgi:type 1 fimbria pilin
MINLAFNKQKLASLLLIAFVSVTAHAQQSSGTTTISGEVLDMACYMKSGAHGDGHKDCAAVCIKGGSPMGILTSDNKVYLLVENHDKAAAYDEAKKHPGEQVTVTGTVSEKNGVNAIIADDVKAKM